VLASSQITKHHLVSLFVAICLMCVLFSFFFDTHTDNKSNRKKVFDCLFCKYAEVTVPQYDWLIKFGCGLIIRLLIDFNIFVRSYNELE
jgi:hypothetical protein